MHMLSLEESEKCETILLSTNRSRVHLIVRQLHAFNCTKLPRILRMDHFTDSKHLEWSVLSLFVVCLP